MLTITSRFSPLNPREYPVSTENVDQVVAEWPVSDDVPVVELDMLPDVSQFALLNPQGSQVSHLSSVQLSPNRIRLDFDMDTLDVFPVFVASPRSGGYLNPISPVSSPESPSSRASPAVALCRARRLRHVGASSGVRPHRCLLHIIQPTCVF